MLRIGVFSAKNGGRRPPRPPHEKAGGGTNGMRGAYIVRLPDGTGICLPIRSARIYSILNGPLVDVDVGTINSINDRNFNHADGSALQVPKRRKANDAAMDRAPAPLGLWR